MPTLPADKEQPEPPKQQLTGDAQPKVEKADAAAKKKIVGQPKKDLGQAVIVELDSFAASGKTDQLWWGSEAPTKHQSLEELDKQIANRIRNTKPSDKAPHAESELQRSKLHKKTVQGVIAIHSAFIQNGFESAAFKDALSQMITSFGLPPIIAITLPAFLSATQHEEAAAAAEVPQLWWSRVSSSALRANSVGEEHVREMQQRLVCEKMVLSSSLKIKEHANVHIWTHLRTHLQALVEHASRSKQFIECVPNAARAHTQSLASLLRSAAAMSSSRRGHETIAAMFKAGETYDMEDIAARKNGCACY